ncbi:muscarinic toxin 7-like [Anolis carolinensis]|uniref:muscarinic toxin 7-like n=1 Tax=Anolis carolinensis TaxID=28377 RepID=UPI002F2B2108
MSMVLAVGIIILVYIGMGEAVRCYECNKVLHDNSCATQPESICSYGMLNLCYNRVIRRGGRITEVTRGCSSLCRHISRRDYEDIMLCCVSELCNNHDFYNN